MYDYAAAELTRSAQTNEEVCTNTPCLLFYFHYFTPIAALGSSSWNETLCSNGTCVSRSYRARDISDFLSFGEIEPALLQARIGAALEKTPCAIESSNYFSKLAPEGFELIERSESIPPLNRLFCLFCQFNG